MKKILLTLALAFYCVAGQGQTTGTPTGVNIKELNAKWAKFSQYAEQKQIDKAVEEGIRVSVLFTQNKQYKEAFATCRQMDALIYYGEQQNKSPKYKQRFMLAKERLRMYTNLKNTEQCKILLKQLHTYSDHLKSDSLREELLMTEAGYYQTFGMTDKSLECYKALFQKRSAGKDEQGIDQCYKDMLGYAEQNNNAPLAIAMRKLYTSWQDSIKAVKAAHELNTLQQKYNISQKTLQEKEDKITINLIIIIALCILSAVLAAGLLFLAALLFKHIRQVKKLKHSLQIANENNEQKSKFIGNISAQIEPSLNTMDEAIAETGSTKILHENIKALKELMTAIQTYISLEETREEHYPIKELNINTLCESIMEKAKINFKPGVEAMVNVPRVNIKTNAEELERILNHLLNNAAEYTESGKISLEFKKRSAHTHQFILTDTGTGIPVEERDKLFKPFAEIRDLTQGNGLGLPTCSLIAYKLNGTLTLDTDYKKGTRFILELHV
ncbi:HAMP domain-containing sensor histidine kinase [uncultured Phocaeicola sp.]|uniref:sensor histidine kinase n=1 Tax=uncultured Phocaeicola sp. TaxID=990718 RepID=UPI001434A236|nr:HAMP domain-containing sensor histidine kinase [uncultured Phocaeicola sp.]GFI00916.1 sensory/regulatory protein RpfC [Bacteroidaceae bacterium]